ncbi:MAG: flavodoxin [Lachnospiraceae bacterium]|nr:flavodoxin [Lachnospiraceae bacterium]
MKKTIVILLSLFLILSLTACGSSANQTEQSLAEGSSSESTEAPESQLEEPEASKVQETEVLVAYFSATNTTEGVAVHIANGLNGELYEILPEDPYTDADLDYNDDNSRTTMEMNDPDARPVIAGSVENMEQLTSGAQWLAGQRFNGSDSQDTVMEWVNGLELDLGE